MPPLELQTNENGSAKLCPITTFEVHIASDEMVIIVFQYVETIEQFDSGQPKQLQVVLPAKRAHELAANLERAATIFLKEGSYCLVQ
jgi:hypothetical protein